MDISASWAFLSLAFTLGMVHALDADHIMAVSVFAHRQRSLRDGLLFSLQWGIGHNLSLLGIGGAVLLLGLAIPESLSHWAEMAVGVMLIGLGAWVLWDLLRQRAHLHFHQHDGFPSHAHWHVHDDMAAHGPGQHRHTHTALMVGLLHGTAGSAPLLVLLPVAASESPWLGLAYLVLFGLGVIIAMVCFGGLLGLLLRRSRTWGEMPLRWFRATVAVATMGSGAYLLAAAA